MLRLERVNVKTHLWCSRNLTSIIMVVTGQKKLTFKAWKVIFNLLMVVPNYLCRNRKGYGPRILLIIFFFIPTVHQITHSYNLKFKQWLTLNTHKKIKKKKIYTKDTWSNLKQNKWTGCVIHIFKMKEGVKCRRWKG